MNIKIVLSKNFIYTTYGDRHIIMLLYMSRLVSLTKFGIVKKIAIEITLNKQMR